LPAWGSGGNLTQGSAAQCCNASVCQRQQGDFGGSFKHSKDPPTNLHEYQNMRLAKIAFRKSLILKDAIWLLGQLRVQGVVDVRKAGASSRTPSTVIYKVKYSTN
jgi:hypothetical protein